jgi:soluble lytic murein transglycosylase-like protein
MTRILLPSTPMRRLSVALILAVAATSASAEVHLTIRSDGRKVISNVGANASRHGSDFRWLAKQRNRRSAFDSIIDRHAVHYGVDPVLVRAVIQVESDFDPHCVSRKGARGLMQLIPETARRYGVQNVLDPDENIRGGVHYLADLLEMFHGDLSRSLAAYNAGENAVLKYAGIPPYEETATYVKRALTVYYGRPYAETTWFSGAPNGRKLAGGFKAATQPVVAFTMPGMRYLGSQ